MKNFTTTSDIDLSDWNFSLSLSGKVCLPTLIVSDFIDCVEVSAYMGLEILEPLNVRIRVETDNECNGPYVDFDISEILGEEIQYYRSEAKDYTLEENALRTRRIEKTKEKLLNLVRQIDQAMASVAEVNN